MFTNKGMLTVLAIFFFVAALPAYSQDAVDTEELLHKAEAFFKDGNELLPTNPELAKEKYRDAIIYYNSIIESGVVNSGLYYNMGNAWFRLDQLGSAILCYRKALLYSPNDPQIKYNLEYARSLQKNGFVADTRHEVLRILLFWHYALPFNVRVVILVIANLIFWTALTIKRFGRTPGWVLIVSCIIALLTAGSLYADRQGSKKLHGVVTAESVTGRMGDSRSYEPAFDGPLYQGVEFTVEQRRVGWILATLPDGAQVWLEEKDCGLVEEDIK